MAIVTHLGQPEIVRLFASLLVDDRDVVDELEFVAIVLKRDNVTAHQQVVEGFSIVRHQRYMSASSSRALLSAYQDFMWTKRGKARLILIANANMAYRSFRSGRLAVDRLILFFHAGRCSDVQ